MRPTIIRSEDRQEDDYGSTKVTTIINNHQWPFFSIARVRKIGDDIKEGYDTESNSVYYVLEGEGECVINGQQHRIKKGDCLVYPQGTTYKHMKGVTLLAIASPRFDREKRVYTK